MKRVAVIASTLFVIFGCCTVSEDVLPFSIVFVRELTFEPKQVKGEKGLFAVPTRISVTHGELNGQDLSVVIAVANDSDHDSLYNLTVEIIDDQRRAYNVTCEPDFFLTNIPAKTVKQTTCTTTISPEANQIIVRTGLPLDAAFRAKVPPPNLQKYFQ